MARLLKTKTGLTMYCQINTHFEDGSIDTKEFKSGDIISLRYVKNQEVIEVQGRVTAIDYTLPVKLSYNAKKPANTLADDVVVNNITIDASLPFNSNIVTVPVREIVEDAGVDGVARMSISKRFAVDTSMEYTNGLISKENLEVGDILDDVVIMTNPGEDDVTGRFTIAAFGYVKSAAGKIDVTSIALEDSEGAVKDYPITKFLSLKEVMQYEINTGDQLADILFDDEVSKVKVTLTDNLSIESGLDIPEGKEVEIDFAGYKMEVPEPVNDRSVYALTNYSDNCVIKNLKVAARGLQNAGNMTLENCEITARDTNGGAALWLYSGSTTFVNDCKLDATHEGSSSDRSGPGLINVQPGAICVVNNGEFTSVNKRCYCIINYGGDLTSNNAITHGAHGGISNDGGELVINGGEYISTEYYGLYSSSDSGNAAHTVVNDGTFNGPNYAVWVGSDPHDDVKSTVEIKGGTFLNKLKNQNNVSEGCGIKVSGGLFKYPVEEEYLADGYVCSEEPNEDGFYTISKAE